MKLLAIISVTLTIWTTAALGQAPAPCGASNDVRFIKDKPTVYITFERFGKALDLDKQKMVQGNQRKKTVEKGSDVWLRVHNNTCWSINLIQYGLYVPKPLPGETMRDVLMKRAGVLDEGIETGLFYSVMKGRNQIAYNGIDSYDYVTLLSGRTVLFSVSREDLAAGQAIRLRFIYSWEFQRGNEKQGSLNNEPDHFVEFSSYDLKEQSEN